MKRSYSAANHARTHPAQSDQAQLHFAAPDAGTMDREMSAIHLRSGKKMIGAISRSCSVNGTPVRDSRVRVPYRVTRRSSAVDVGAFAIAQTAKEAALA